MKADSSVSRVSNMKAIKSSGIYEWTDNTQRRLFYHKVPSQDGECANFANNGQ